METPVARKRGRPRKRRRNEDDNVTIAADSSVKKRAVESSPKRLVGQYVLKEFDDNGVFLGKIVYYDTGLYRVEYEDGDCEDLESRELRQLILDPNYFDDDLSMRRKKLDELALKDSVKNQNEVKKKEKTAMDKVEASTMSELSCGGTVDNDGAQVEGDADSSSDSCECAQDRDLGGVEVEAPVVPPPKLPPSSGTIGVPEESVSHLFSVYGFLRSFSIQLFLSPFGLDDFVGSLNCAIQNTLLDAVHVALMCVLKRHLEALSSDGLELASKCLRCIDWTLLDAFTWPVYLVHYFTVKGHAQVPEWKGFYDDVLGREYYSLPVGRKLMILQILCDDLLESLEIRAEINMREELEVGVDSDAFAMILPENGPRRVHPRYSKTSACKDREAMEIIAENHVMRSSCNSKFLGSKSIKVDADASNTDVDENGDECRLCGMDGTLLCCDGCPSAYHSRCIGVIKTYIPEGPWYCPECTISKIGPTITMGTSLKGAEIFGIDLYGQIFLGTCNHLLVLKAFPNTAPCLRYYNQNDILKVLQSLFSSMQHASLYRGICKAILQYWSIPERVFSPPELIETGIGLANLKQDEKISVLSIPGLGKESHKVAVMIEVENVSSLSGSNADNVAVSCLDTSMDSIIQSDLPISLSNGDTARTQGSGVTIPPEPIKMESAVSNVSASQQADPLDFTHQSLVDKSSMMDLTSCNSANSNGSCTGHLNGVHLRGSMPTQSKERYHAVFGSGDRNSVINCVYVGSCFKPQAYTNHYVHGDFAASAAANLAAISSEEGRVSEAHKLSNARKVASASILLQVKAFSTAASRFFWPSSEKRLMEVPRERCSWCYSCKLPASSRRGCMLNSAVSNATKGAMKILNGLHPIKSVEGSLPTIATYILYMEESLSGLIVGSFLSPSDRKQWRKQVEEASSCRAIGISLLELEKNIRTIALSGDWVKLMDEALVESPVTQSAACTVGTTQKRGPTGKRHGKKSVVSGVTADCCDRCFSWWRGGELSNLIFQKAILPRSMAKKAARQGGLRRVPGVCYTDGSEIPKRSRHLIWRAAVEDSKTSAQLALQVRYLDLHVRWSDLVRPEQHLQDGKGPETEASAFRNAIICDKRTLENKIRYGVAFGNQKHLPSRVMKNIIEVEQSQDVKEKYWFSETCIPLYLIKEYEESVAKVHLLPAKKSLTGLSELQKRQLKASRKDIFSYLTCKRDKLDKCSCASCQQDVLLRNVVTCSACQGYCHKDCNVGSKIYKNEQVEFLITCRRCYHVKTFTRNENSNESSSGHLPLPFQRQEDYNAVTVTKGTKIKGHNQPLVSVRTQESCSETKRATSESSQATKARHRTWGIIWKKKHNEDTGIDFRRKNVLLKGSSEASQLKPVCRLCQKAYNSDLMYIHCETCKNWFHADAVELEESKLSDVVGFKCCKCRRIKSPECPYKDNPDGDKPCKMLLRRGTAGGDPDSGIISEHKESEPITPNFPKEEPFVRDDDPLFFSLSRVDQVAGHDSGVDFDWSTACGPGPQKLPVRRLVKRQEDTEGFSGNNFPCGETSMLPETNHLASNKGKDEISIPSAEWDVSVNNFEGELAFDYQDFNYEDMEFEPQTYFSFTELLASDDGGQLDGVDASGEVLNLENQSCAILQDQVPGQDGKGTLNDQAEPKISTKPAEYTPHCRMCSHTQPTPDLSCEICGLFIHGYCSPWLESSPGEGNWRCGGCREWH